MIDIFVVKLTPFEKTESIGKTLTPLVNLIIANQQLEKSQSTQVYRNKNTDLIFKKKSQFSTFKEEIDSLRAL